MTPTVAIAVAILAPLCVVPVIALLDSRPNARETATLLAAVVTFLAVASLFDDVAGGARPTLVVGEMLIGLPLAFEVEPLGMVFAGIASFLWIITTIYAIGYMRGHDEENQTRFYICFAIAISSALGIAFAANMLTLFVFYEVLTLSTFPLVTHSGTEEAKRAGRVYLGILIGTSIVLQLTAIIWTWSITGTLDFVKGGILANKATAGLTAVLLAMYVFGIGKAALMPFHRWLPAAMVAPTPVSALLHAVAVVKAGVFTVLKVTIYIFGIDNLAQLGSSVWLQYVAAATILIASLVAMRKDNLKARLAYSTVSQLSYIVLAAMLVNATSAIGGGMHIVMHAFGKITLFFCAGAFMVASHKTEISQMRGIGKSMPLTTFAFLIGSLSIIGLPVFGGIWSKWYIGIGALEANQLVMVAVLMISSLLNVAYLLPIPFRGFFDDAVTNPPATDHGGGHNHSHGADAHHADGIREAPLPCLIAIAVTSIGCVVLFFYPEPIYDLLKQMF